MAGACWQQLPLFMAAVLVLNATPGVDLLLTVSRTRSRACVPASWPRWASTPAARCTRWRRPSAWPRCWPGRPRPSALLKWAGAAYLLWLGFGMLRSAWRGPARRRRGAMRRPRRAALGRGRLPPRPAHQPAEPEGGAVHAGLPAAVHPGAVGAQDAGLPGAGPAVRRAEHALPAGRGAARGAADAGRRTGAQRRARCRPPAACCSSHWPHRLASARLD